MCNEIQVLMDEWAAVAVEAAAVETPPWHGMLNTVAAGTRACCIAQAAFAVMVLEAGPVKTLACSTYIPTSLFALEHYLSEPGMSSNALQYCRAD